MFSEEQLTTWFTYHPPTSETEPKYAAIRKAEQETAALLGGVVARAAEEPAFAAARAAVNEQFLKFAQTINEQCPDSADKTTAVRCVRRSRMATNEALQGIHQRIAPNTVSALLHVAGSALMEARWWACSAVACEGE